MERSLRLMCVRVRVNKKNATSPSRKNLQRHHRKYGAPTAICFLEVYNESRYALGSISGLFARGGVKKIIVRHVLLASFVTKNLKILHLLNWPIEQLRYPFVEPTD